MRAEPISILLDEKYKLDKNFYFVSGNEITLIEKIAETKMSDLNANTIDQAKEMIRGTAKSMGIEVKG